MKRANKVLGLLAAATLAPLAAWADDKDDDDRDSHAVETGLTIAEIVAASGGEFDRNRRDFDILLNAVIAADLVDALADPDADLTVLAPNDAAFLRLARALGYKPRNEAEAFEGIVETLTVLGEGDPIPVLTNILLYHVSPGSQYLYEIIFADQVQTLLGATILPNGRVLFDNEPEVRYPRLFLSRGDIIATNGKIHTIDGVLIPVDLDNVVREPLPTITDIVAASGGEFDKNGKDFDILLNAVVTAGLAETLADRDGRFTVFAPDDLAFIRAARLLGYHGRKEDEAFAFIVAALTELGEGDPIGPLTDILLYHVLGEEVSAKAALESEQLTTLLGATITPDLANRELIDNDPSRNPGLQLWRADKRAANGFVQPISRVLLPIPVSE
ncbi:MAG: fasciclin domain-containing protein [Woeseiaceae bacterium]|nr:fasciclin domain-containing protein [Woeseiaceae bacterium]